MEKSQKTRPIPAQDLSILCAQISLILKSAIPIEEGLIAISQNTENGVMKSISQKLSDAFIKRGNLSDAFAECDGFPNYLINMVRIGETSGKLDEVMGSLSEYYDRENSIKNQIKSAVIYPLILMGMITAVMAVLVIKVLPIFKQVFENLGADMSGISGTMIYTGTAIGTWAFGILIVLLLLACLCCIFSKTSHGKIIAEKIRGFLPYTRHLSEKINSSRFASVMSMLITSGYDTTEALNILPTVIGNAQISAKVKICREQMEQGDSFVQSLQKASMFPGLYSSMISIASKTGNLDTVLNDLAKRYDDEASNGISGGIAVIEPIMVGILSIVIGAVLLSVMLPLMGIMSSII